MCIRDRYYIQPPNQSVHLHIDQSSLPDMEPVARHYFNADGERADEVPKNPEEVLRVLVAGGSAAECYLLDQPSSWPMVAQREIIARTSRPAHVGNVGRSLIPCEVINRALVKSLDRFRSLDVIVLMVGASDVVGWLEQKTPPKLLPDSIPLPKVCPEHPLGPFGWNKKKLALYRLIRRVNARLRKPVSSKHGAGKRLVRNREMRASAKHMIDQVPDATPMLAFYEEHLRNLITTCKSYVPRVLVVRQPWFKKDFTPEEQARMWNFGQGRPYVEELDTYYTHRLVSELMDKADQITTRVAEDAGVEQLDLMPLLPRDFGTYYDFLHFTPKGAEKVGKAVAAAILESSTIPPQTVQAQGQSPRN